VRGLLVNRSGEPEWLRAAGKSGALRLACDYLPARTRASFRRSTVNVMPAPMTMRASVALKLPGAMQLIQVPMIAGASYTVRPSLKKPYPLDGPQSGEVNPLSFARAWLAQPGRERGIGLREGLKQNLMVLANCETTSEIVPEFARKLTGRHKGEINGSEFWCSSTDRPTRGCADMAYVGCGFCDDRSY
jgi:hypothetical protein